MSSWRTELESWLKTIDVSGSVLDVGGDQKNVKGRTKSWDVNQYEIYDLEEDLDVHWRLGERFDNVFCLETVMYCKDPVCAVKNLVGRTGKNLYISNPLSAYPETKPAGTDMSRLFPNWWKYWLTERGMKIVEIKIVEPHHPEHFRQAIKSEGYKAYRSHGSGILIHAIKA